MKQVQEQQTKSPKQQEQNSIVHVYLSHTKTQNN